MSLASPNDARNRFDALSTALLQRVLTPIVALWCAFLLVTWVPTYLTWTWWADSEHFALLAQSWASGILPYRDMFSFQFPGEIYVFYALGKTFGWGNTVAYYAFDASLVILFSVILVAWGRKLSGSLLPGLIGTSTFLLFYLSQNSHVAGQREWHATFLVVTSLILPFLGTGAFFRLTSAFAFGLALVVRPQVVVILPAILFAIDGSARASEESWTRTLKAMTAWAVVASLTLTASFLPLIWAGVVGNLLDCLKEVSQSSYNQTGFRQLLLRILPHKLPLSLISVIPLILLFMQETQAPARRAGWSILLALAGVVFYSAISPMLMAYHAIPQVAIASLGVTFFATQLLGQARDPRLTLATLTLTFLFFGASEAPLSLKALRPGDDTNSIPVSLKSLLKHELPPAPPLGYDNTASYPWTDHRAALLYLREKTTLDTLVANLMIDNRAALTSQVPRLTPLVTADVGSLLMLNLPSLLDRNALALQSAPPSTVVLWNPHSPEASSPRYDHLFSTVRRFYHPETQLGNIAVWRKNPH